MAVLHIRADRNGSGACYGLARTRAGLVCHCVDRATNRLVGRVRNNDSPDEKTNKGIVCRT